MKTVRRRTKAFERALASAEDITVFSLENCFCGKRLDPDNPNLIMSPRDWLRRELGLFSFAKLREQSPGVFCLRVHSNLWYEFHTAGEEG